MKKIAKICYLNMSSSHRNGETYTITFGECVENHAGMQKIGLTGDIGDGFTVNELQYLASLYPQTSEFYSLNTLSDQDPAAILIIRNGCQFMGINPDNVFNEQRNLDKDKKLFSYGSVMNKHARWNLCFADFGQWADFANGKGTIVNFSHLPYTNHIRTCLPYLLGIKASNLLAEGNYYYDTSKCGIGWHGDFERRKVVGLRFGDSLPLCFRWYKDSIGQDYTFRFLLNHGDLYIFSEKAAGTDWKRRSIWTLRHSAGCDKYTK